MVSVAVIGSGAVGCYYGALLARAGHDVRFLMRRDLAAVRANGLDIRSHLGDFQLREVQAFAASEEIGPVDWVICSLKTTVLDDAERLVKPCLGRSSRILALMNGLGVEERLAAWAAPGRVFGGMAFVCINRGAPGVVHHLKYGRLSLGHLGDDATQTAELATLFAGAGAEVTAAPDLCHARWEKLCWNIPFNGLSVAAGGIGTQAIIDDAALRATAERAMREVIAAGNADLAARGSASRISEAEMVGRMFALTESMGDYRTSMAIDYVQGQPLEVETILGQPVRRALELGVATPTMDALYALVRAADLRLRGVIAALTLETL